MADTGSVYIFDRYPVFGAGLQSLLEKDWLVQVSGMVSTEPELFTLLRKKQPHLLLINAIHSPDGCCALIRTIRSRFADLRILVLFNENLPLFQILEMVQAGVEGMVGSDEGADHLRCALRTVISGRTRFPARLTTLSAFRETLQLTKLRGIPSEPGHFLTPREREVLKYLSTGLTAKEIGLRLFISQRTVESHKNNLMAKLHLRHKADLIRYALLHLS